jgi:biopolymer transport protein ExbB
MITNAALYRLMQEGGWVMWILLAFSIVMVTVALQKGLVLRRATTATPPLLAAVRASLLDQGSTAEAVELCRQQRGAVATVLAAGLLRAGSAPERLERILESASLTELRRLRRGLGVLSTTAMTAPLLGFLGTVTGMMVSFQAFVDHGINNPAMVALGIKEALTTTAAGLAVAVPAQLLHQALSSRLGRIEGDLETAGNFLLDMLQERAADRA